MHCVICGVFLNDENQAGLNCLGCKQEREVDRKAREQVISVNYCYRCGRPYHPDDMSIQHESCFVEDI